MKRALCCLMAVLLSIGCVSVALSENGKVRDYETISRETPVKVGEIASFAYTKNDMSVILSITDVKRGKAALDAILKANEYNDKPKADETMCLATIHVAMKCATDERLELDWMDFEYVTSDGVADYVGYYSGISSDLKLYPGGSGDMQIAFVTKAEDVPLLLFQEGIWLSLEP